MSDIKQKIKESKIILVIKKLLINDCDQQLEGTFGFQKDGTLEELSNLPNIKEGSSEHNTRGKIRNFIFNKTKSSLTAKQARKDLIKEYSFTYINRFIAFKLLEKREIIEETVSKGFKSKGFIFYMAKNPEDEQLYRQGKEHEAYKRFFLYQCKVLSNDEEIKLLFDPESLVSRLFPKEITLNKIFSLLNDKNLCDIWKEDEVIGWVYQYFIEDDKEFAFSMDKIPLEYIAPATQIFTPKWIVRYLVQNTLGRLWIKMHPDSNIKEKLNYYVPNKNDKGCIEFKSVKDITMLDPACGTMHFGMVAFDLFYDMYVEELKKQGCKGWPKVASVKSINEIPQAIIENNIYGIEIDYRSIQLSALSLYLKAKSINRDSSIQKYNLVCTNISNFTDDDINSFINSISYKYEVTKKLLRLIIPELNKAYYLGSLLKIEDTINDFISKEKISLEERFKEQLDLYTTEEQRQLALEEGVSWEDVKEELLKAMEEFINEANGGRESYLALESKKGIGLINALIKNYDVVTTNPPFMGNRSQCLEIKSYLNNFYHEAKMNLYSVFIERCVDLLYKNGFLGMITGQTFLFISSFEKFRKKLIVSNTFLSLLHFDYGLFPEVRMDTCCFILRKQQNNVKTTYFRLIEGNDVEKFENFEDALEKYKKGEKSDEVFILPQEKLKQIPSWPFVYWISDGIRQLFLVYKQLSEFAEPKVGLKTADNFRFLRFWWEITGKNIYFNSNSRIEAKISSKKWFPYMKGGEVNKWYGNQSLIVNWFDDGKEIIEWCKYLNEIHTPGGIAVNKEYYFEEGATYSFLTVSNLSVRYMPKGFIFDVAGSSIFPKKTNIYLLIGILNSKITTYLIKLLNPTVNYQVGDLARIPYSDESKNPELVNKIIENVKNCIELKKELIKTDELSWEFVKLPDWNNGILNTLEEEKKLAVLESEISRDVYKLYNISPEDIKQIESEFGRLPAELEAIKDLNSEKLKIIDKLYLEKHIPKVILNNDDTTENSEESINNKNHKKNNKGNARYLTFEELCLASGFHPETVYEYIKKNKLERKEERYQLAIKYISYAVGIIMGRYKVDGIVSDDDGIAVIDRGHNDDLPKKIELILNKIVGEENTNEMIKIIGGDLRKFLNYEFFTKHHIKMYKKRPVYWLLQTSKKDYGFYIYNIKFTNDTLYSLIQKYINPKIKLEESRLEELKGKDINLSSGKEKREIGKLIDKGLEFLGELGDFKEKVNEVIDPGYRPYIDDGVILNMAPLYKLISWKEPEKYYMQLKEGKYGWSNIFKIVKKSNY